MKRALLAVLALSLSVLPSAKAWWAQAHHTLTLAAVDSTTGELPAFFRDGKGMIAHAAGDPDVLKSRDTPALRATESPEHFIDWELLQGRELPPTRYEYLALCGELGVDPTKAGTLPYALMEWTQRLAIAFAEHRRWPDNLYIQQKALFIAGILAHYAGDTAQPLHCTIHYDGRALDDGSSPRTGIHSAVDGLPITLELSASDFTTDHVEPFTDLFKGVLKAIEQSRIRLDALYAMEAAILSDSAAESAEVRVFTLERGRAAAHFTATLYHTAWAWRFENEMASWVEDLRSRD